MRTRRSGREKQRRKVERKSKILSLTLFCQQFYCNRFIVASIRRRCGVTVVCELLLELINYYIRCDAHSSSLQSVNECSLRMFFYLPLRARQTDFYDYIKLWQRISVGQMQWPQLNNMAGRFIDLLPMPFIHCAHNN